MDPYAEAGGFSLDDSVSAGKKERKIGSHNLTPLTCADIANMKDEKFTFQNHQAEKVSLCGVVRSLDITAIKAVLVIDDRTGPAVTCQSMDVSDSDLNKLQIGCYVKVFGMIRQISPNKDDGMRRIINVLRIRPCASLNLVSQHMLECARAKTYYLTANKRLETAQETQDSIKMEHNGASTSGLDGSKFGAETLIGGLNDKQNKVMLFLKTHSSEENGVHVSEIVSRLRPSGVSERDVRDSLEFLSNEGHIYSTIDEETYTIVAT